MAGQAYGSRHGSFRSVSRTHSASRRCVTPTSVARSKHERRGRQAPSQVGLRTAMAVLGVVGLFVLIDLALVGFGIFKFFTRNLDRFSEDPSPSGGAEGSRLYTNGWIWLLTIAVVAGYPLSAFSYYPLLLRTGTLPTDADSIAIPMGYAVMLSIVAYSPIVTLTYACTRRRASKMFLLAWRPERPMLSLVLTAVSAGLVLYLLYSICFTLFRSDFMSIDLAWIPHEMLCIVWILTLRSAALGEHWKAKRFDEGALFVDSAHRPLDLKNG